MTSRVGANENSYVVKEDNLLKSGETYVQVYSYFYTITVPLAIIIAAGSSYS